MKKLFALAVCAVLALAGNRAFAIDTILTKDSPRGMSGTLVSVSATEVVFKKANGQSETIPANAVLGIRFDGEPGELRVARSHVISGNFDNALKSLEKVDPAELKGAEVKQDFEFYSALCNGRLALLGTGDVKAAGNQVREFVNGQANSYHFYEATLLLGELYVAAGAHALAEAEFKKLEQTNWKDMQLKGAVARGRALLAQGDVPNAATAFDAALAIAGDDASEEIKPLKMSAQMGKARCQAEGGQVEEALAALEQVIKDTPTDDRQLLAQAYITQGNCYKKSNRDTEALIAFLHVDVLYASFPEEHAEALHHLADLFLKQNNQERAIQCRQTLQERYKNSPWAK